SKPWSISSSNIPRRRGEAGRTGPARLAEALLNRFPHIVPTRRAVVLLALAAPLAVIVAALAPGAWIVAPALGGALLALVIADALMAGACPDLRLALPPDVEGGAETRLVAYATFGAGQRRRAEVSLRCDA